MSGTPARLAADVVGNFPRELREARQAAGMSRAYLARASGVTEREIHALETGGRTDPHLSTVIRLAAGLSVPLGDLLAGY